MLCLVSTICLRHSLCPLIGLPSCSAHSFGTQGFQHCPSTISCLQDIYVVLCCLLHLPAWSMHSHKVSQLVWYVRMTIGKPPIVVCPCWLFRAFGWTSLSCLPPFQFPSSMHARACTTLTVFWLDFCSFLGLLCLTRARNHGRHTQQYVRLVSAPTFFTMLPLILLIRSASCICSSWRCLSRSANPLPFLARTANGWRRVSLGCGSGVQRLEYKFAATQWYGLATRSQLYFTDLFGFQGFRHCPSTISYFQSMHVV